MTNTKTKTQDERDVEVADRAMSLAARIVRETAHDDREVVGLLRGAVLQAAATWAASSGPKVEGAAAREAWLGREDGSVAPPVTVSAMGRRRALRMLRESLAYLEIAARCENIDHDTFLRLGKALRALGAAMHEAIEARRC